MRNAFIFREHHSLLSDSLELIFDDAGDLFVRERNGRISRLFLLSNGTDTPNIHYVTPNPPSHFYTNTGHGLCKVRSETFDVGSFSHKNGSPCSSSRLAKSQRLISLYDDCEVICNSEFESVIWSRNFDESVGLFSVSPSGELIVVPTSICSLEILRSCDGSTVSCSTTRYTDVDSRIVSIEWNLHNIVIGYSNGCVELLTDDLRHRCRIECNVPIFGATQSSDGSLMAVSTTDLVNIYSVRLSQIVLSLNVSDSLSNISNAKWIKSCGDNRLAVVVGRSVQLIALKEPKSVCWFNEDIVAYISENSINLESFKGIVESSIQSAFIIESVIGVPNEPVFVANMRSQTDSIIRMFDRSGHDCVSARIFENTTRVRACDYCGTTIACTDGVFVILLFGEVSIAYLSIHLPIVSQTGNPPMSSQALKASDDIVVDMSFGGSEILAVARRSGIVQVYGIDGDGFRLMRSVRAIIDYAPSSIFVSGKFAILLDEGSRMFFGKHDMAELKQLENRSTCWKCVACPHGEYFGVSDRDCVFIYRTKSATEPVLIDAIRIGIDLELLGIFKSEAVMFNWQTRQVHRVATRPIREWTVLKNASPPPTTRCLVDFVTSNGCKRMWQELSEELIFRKEYTEARKCLAKSKDWLGTVLVNRLKQGMFSETDVNRFYITKQVEEKSVYETEGIDTDEFITSCRSVDPSQFCRHWKSFSGANIMIMCDSLLRKGEVSGLKVILEQIDLSVYPHLRNFLIDVLSVLILSNETRAAIQVCIVQLQEIQRTIELVVKYNGWDHLILILNSENISVRIMKDELERVLKMITDSEISPKSALCLILLARRSGTEICHRVMADLCKEHWAPLGPVPRKLCLSITHRLQGNTGSISQFLIRYTNAHVALYSGDAGSALTDLTMIPLTDTEDILKVGAESILCLMALSALLSLKRTECSTAFTKLQSQPSVPVFRQKLYRNLSRKVFGGEGTWR